ncbi:MAG: hypothetical protein RR334_01475 [Clostridia bacterium]
MEYQKYYIVMKSLNKLEMGSGVLFIEQNGTTAKFVFENAKSNLNLKLFLKTDDCMEIADINSNKTEVYFNNFLVDDTFVAIIMNSNDYPVLYGSKDAHKTYSTASLNDYIKCKIACENSYLFEEDFNDEIITECISAYETLDNTIYSVEKKVGEPKFIDVVMPCLNEIMSACPHEDILETEIKNSEWVITPTDEKLLIGVIKKENKIVYVSIGYPVISFKSYTKKLEDSHLFKATSFDDCEFGYELLIVEAETGKPHIFTNYA